MRRRPPKLVHLERSERHELQRLLEDGRTEQRVARRCRVRLAMADSETIVDDLTREVRMTRTGVWYIGRRYEQAGLEAIYDAPRTGRPREISELERVAIQQLACCELQGLKMELTHWSTRSLTTIARQRLHRPHLACSTVSLILRDAQLQPHRSQARITPTLTADFVQRATSILWLYERVQWLLARDELVLAVDEKPNLSTGRRTSDPGDTARANRALRV